MYLCFCSTRNSLIQGCYWFAHFPWELESWIYISALTVEKMERWILPTQKNVRLINIKPRSTFTTILGQNIILIWWLWAFLYFDVLHVKVSSPSLLALAASAMPVSLLIHVLFCLRHPTAKSPQLPPLEFFVSAQVLLRINFLSFSILLTYPSESSLEVWFNLSFGKLACSHQPCTISLSL